MVNVTSSCWDIFLWTNTIAAKLLVLGLFNSCTTIYINNTLTASLPSIHISSLRSNCTCHGPAVLLELAGEEAFSPGHLLVPGLQYSLSLPRFQGQGVWMGLIDVRPHPLQAVRILQLPTHHAHQQLVEWVVVHEVTVPPHDIWDRTFLTIVILIVTEQ